MNADNRECESHIRQRERNNPPTVAAIDGLRAGLEARSLKSTLTPISPILLDDLLPTTTAEHVLPRTALEIHPELKGTVWHRVGFRTATTILAHVLLGTEGDERISALAHRLAHVITAEGKATALDGKVLVTAEGTATAFGERTLYVMRCDR